MFTALASAGLAPESHVLKFPAEERRDRYRHRSGSKPVCLSPTVMYPSKETNPSTKIRSSSGVSLSRSQEVIAATTTSVVFKSLSEELIVNRRESNLETLTAMLTRHCLQSGSSFENLRPQLALMWAETSIFLNRGDFYRDLLILIQHRKLSTILGKLVGMSVVCCERQHLLEILQDVNVKSCILILAETETTFEIYAEAILVHENTIVHVTPETWFGACNTVTLNATIAANLFPRHRYLRPAPPVIWDVARFTTNLIETVSDLCLLGIFEDKKAPISPNASRRALVSMYSRIILEASD